MVQQFSLKAGLSRFGDRTKASVTKELQQHHNMKVYQPMDPNKMTQAQKDIALESIIFLTEKRTGEIKTCAVADRSKQRRCPGYKKEESASPTVSSDSIFITGAIEAHKGRKVACYNIPGTFLHADCEDGDTYMLLKDHLTELMVLVDPKLYREYVRYSDKGQAMLYLRMSKALYGMLKSALWFYKLLAKDLKEYGFEVNAYDPCVANATINGKQMTVTWHIDDLKASHEDINELKKFGNFLKSKYEKDGMKLTEHYGDVHDYLGINLDYSKKGQMGVSMIQYLTDIINGFSKDIGKPAPCPAAAHLFQVRDEKDTEYISEEKAREFHHVTAQLLFLCNRAHRDIQTAVAFLTTRVNRPDIDDWGKLCRVLKYLREQST